MTEKTDGRSTTKDSFLEDLAKGFKEALAFAQSCNLHLPGQPTTVLVAFSGGADSTALLLGLRQLEPQLQIAIAACHVNHGLRGQESNDDESFCRDLCKKNGINFISKSIEAADKQQQPSEEQLRDARYNQLIAAAGESKAQIIATAHTQDDQSETLLFRLFRGTGRPGLTGIKQARMINDVLILRPMLKIAKDNCLSFLKSVGVSAREDSSNNNLAYRRNFIRHRVLPTIKQEFPVLNQSLSRLGELLAEEEKLIEEISQLAILQLETGIEDVWDRIHFDKLPQAIKRRVIWQAFNDRDVEASFDRVEACLDTIAANSTVSLNETWDLSAGNNIAWINKSNKTPVADIFVEMKIPGITPLLQINRALKSEVWESGTDFLPFPSQNDLTAIVDLSRVCLPLVVRTRAPGDTIQPFGMSEMVKLKKYLHNHKSTSGNNSLANIVVADQNEVIWVPGIGLSEKIKVTNKPSHRLTWLTLATDQTIC